jgi:hypothetical protein
MELLCVECLRRRAYEEEEILDPTRVLHQIRLAQFMLRGTALCRDHALSGVRYVQERALAKA